MKNELTISEKNELNEFKKDHLAKLLNLVDKQLLKIQFIKDYSAKNKDLSKIVEDTEKYMNSL